MGSPYLIDFKALSLAYPALSPVSFVASELLGVQQINGVWLIALFAALVLLISFDGVFQTISSGSTLRFEWRGLAQGVFIFFAQAFIFRLAAYLFVGFTLLVLAPRLAASIRDSLALRSELEPGGVMVVLFWCSVLAMEDLARYLAHRLQHSVPVLWELHKFHHSATSLNVLVSYREHPLIGMLNGGASLLFALVLAVPWLVFMPGLLAAPPIYIGGMIAFVVYKCIFLLGHFHRPISYGFLDRLLVTSAVHALHHSDNPSHFNRNFGGLLTLW